MDNSVSHRTARPCWRSKARSRGLQLPLSPSRRSPCAIIAFVAAHGWQTLWHKHPGVRSGDQLTLGERAADRMRNMMGSWPFVFCFFGIMIAWAVVNSAFYLGGQHGKHGFDPYPYILLNLFLSMLAGVQAAALLIAAKRADAISSEIAIHTEKNTEDLKGLVNDNTSLTEQVKLNTDLLDEIHRHVAVLSPGAGKFAPGEQPPPS